MSDTENQAAEAAPEKRGVGTIIREALAANQTNEEALAAVKAEMPDAKTSASTVSWYRNAMRKEEGSTVPTARELKKARKDAAAKPEADPLQEE